MSLDYVDVLQVITSASPRGAERYAVMLEPELEDRGLRVRTVALHPGSSPGLAVETLGQSKVSIQNLRSLRRACRSAAVVIAHGSATLLACSIATLGTGVPFVYRNIGDPVYWASSSRRRLQTALFLSRAEMVVALTAEAGRRMADLYRVAPASLVTIPNGVPVGSFARRTDEERVAARKQLDIGSGQRVALVLGALSPEKDVATALTAHSYLPDEWVLAVVGDGPQREELQRLAARISTERVRLLGQVDDPLEVLRAADVLVLSSLTEGQPGVIIEAAMVGVPAVATDVGFVSELIDEDVSGYVVPVSDPKAMAMAIVRAGNSSGRLGEAAHKRAVREFSMSRTADQWYSALSSFVGGRVSGSS